jgi:hypothetical protein
LLRGRGWNCVNWFVFKLLEMDLVRAGTARL